MKKIKNQKRVINIPKEDFDVIKSYCDDHSLDMVKWITKNSLEKTKKKLPLEIVTAKEAIEIKKNALKVELPENWLNIVLERIDEDVKYNASNFSTGKNKCVWRPYVNVENVYGCLIEIKLTPNQISTVTRELNNRGFALMVEPIPGSMGDYTVTW